MTAFGAERKLCLYYACLKSLYIAQKRPLRLSPYLFIKKSKGPRGEWNEDCTSSNKSEGCLVGRESAVVVSTGHVLWLHCMICRFPQGFSAWSGWDLPDMLGLYHAFSVEFFSAKATL